MDGTRLLEVDNHIENTWTMETFLPPWNADECSPFDKCCTCWIGGSDRHIEGVFTWNDLTNITYKNWFPGQPDGVLQGDCVSFCRDGYWDDNTCLTLEDEMGPLDCLDGWFRYENHCYYVNTTAVTWNEAKFQCEINGARLIEIESDSENTWVMETFLPPWTNAECSKWWDCCDCWIGATDIDTEGVFTWNHVTNITYSNWYIDQPDNLQMGHCVVMCRNGFWDDLDYRTFHLRTQAEVAKIVEPSLEPLSGSGSSGSSGSSSGDSGSIVGKKRRFNYMNAQAGIVVYVENGGHWLLLKGSNYDDTPDTFITDAALMNSSWICLEGHPVRNCHYTVNNFIVNALIREPDYLIGANCQTAANRMWVLVESCI
ncbi:macrophage mannose receptor 1-like [Saccostrea cucullata]|uniref:macrophage mannose receptor 1-like n=1 Tax=Saccostrea cuccullata TaxID=36930 RepID=UPI002ED35860